MAGYGSGAMISEPLLFDSGFTRWSENWGSNQHKPCARFEMRWMKCISASGLTRGKDFCQDYFEDFYECSYNYKSNLRVWKMQQVRKQKGRPFLEAPPYDTWHPYEPRLHQQFF
jgi:hypothetical protein